MGRKLAGVKQGGEEHPEDRAGGRGLGSDTGEQGGWLESLLSLVCLLF